MFGGLDVKGASSKDDEQERAEASNEVATSAFSFLSGAAPVATPAPSAFSFLGGADESAMDENEVTAEAAAPDSAAAPSAFSFMTAPASPKKIQEAKGAEPASSFKFLKPSPAEASPVETDSDKVDAELAEAEPPATSSFAFLSAPSSTASSSPSDPLPDIMSKIPTSESLPPAGSGIVFGGAAAVKKKTIKKRTRGIKVGQGRTEPVPAPLPPRPISPVAATLEHQAHYVKRAEPNEETQDDSTKDGALEAVRRAEEFMQKMQHDQDTSESFQPPTLQSTDSVDKTYEAAKAAAEEAEAQMARPKRAFGLGWFPRKSAGTRENSMASVGSGTNLSSLSMHDAPTESTAAERIRKEQDDIKRAMAERHLAMHQIQSDMGKVETDSAQPSHHSGDGILPVEELPHSSSQASPWSAPTSTWSLSRAAASPPPLPPKKTPKENLQDMLATFERSVKDAMYRVSQLRQQRNMLLEERFVSLAKERLSIQQIAQAEAQQMSAAEAEDFDLADRLAAVIDGHASEKAELDAILENIGRALEQLETQRHDVVGGVAACFETVQTQLETFQEEQESTERKDDTESMKRFSSTARQLSAENERLQNDFKILERDEELMTEERKELELAIHEQTEDLERHRDEAKDKLATVENEIEDLRKLLLQKTEQASTLRADIDTHESGISRVRVKFSRQLTRVEKKEFSLKENRSEWENEKVAYESLKTAHEAEVQEHSEALLAHDDLMTTLKREIALSTTLRNIVAKEIVFESATDKDEETDGDFAQLQADVVKCEAAASEGKQLLKATVGVLDNLEREHHTLMERIPVLEEEKKSAVSRRDFKAAGKASKEIKDATARLHDCIEELTGDAAERKKAAEIELKKLEEELEIKRVVAHEKEKEVGIVAMENVAKKIMRLVATKRDICGEATPGTIQGVGALVLKAQLDALRREGQSYGAKFGGWDELMADIDDDDESVSPVEGVAGQLEDQKGDDDRDRVTGVEADRSPDEVDPARIARFKEVTDRLKGAEESLEAAVAKEDYDEAAQLDETFQEIKTELETLNLTDAELEIAMREDMPAEGDVPSIADDGETNVVDRLKGREEPPNSAVSNEDYDEAAQLDETFQEIKSELETLKLTDAELEAAMDEGMPAEGDGTATHSKDIENEDGIDCVERMDDEAESPQVEEGADADSPASEDKGVNGDINGRPVDADSENIDDASEEAVSGMEVGDTEVPSGSEPTSQSKNEVVAEPGLVNDEDESGLAEM